MRKLKCPSCGANLQPDSYYCGYCGAFFEKETKEVKEEQRPYEEKSLVMPKEISQTIEEPEEDLYADDHFVSTEEIENSRLNSILEVYANIHQNPIFPILFFLLIFFMMLSGAVAYSPFLTIVIIIVVSGVLNKTRAKQVALLALYQRGAYREAYQILSIKDPNNLDVRVIKQKILLCYYRLDEKEEAKKLITKLITMPYPKDVHIEEVANKLNVIYNPKGF